MKRILLVLPLLTALSLAACGGSGDESSVVTFNSPEPVVDNGGPVLPQQPPQPTDYSKVSCGNTPDCARACDLSYPFLETQELSNLLCSAPFQTATSTCNSLQSLNITEGISPNQACKSEVVTRIMDPKYFGGERCADNIYCQKMCSLLFAAVTDESIERAAAASGGLNSGATLKTIYRNHLVMHQYQTCMNSLTQYVFDNRNNF